MKYNTDDLRIESIKAVTSPAEITEEIPITEKAAITTYETREAIHNILQGKDKRLLVIAGPCSIHDTKAALEYAQKLKTLKDKYSNELLIVMRVYFEKPRTTVGWKGLINDPELNNSFHINKGIRLARTLLLKLNDMGIPAGTEYLDLITPQYVTDLISWGAIGARTTESQVHRELASGLSCPVGFKNGTDGNIKVAVDAIGAAIRPHHFLSLRKEGNSAIFATKGNPDCHIILRGGKTPNYDKKSVETAAEALRKAGLPDRIMIDFSHANSRKQPRLQLEVGRDIATQIADGERHIFGVMIESHLVEGRQDVEEGKDLTYGQSITDACIGWDDTEKLISQLAEASGERIKSS
ncbi:MAG: 3-deoxy-7-phosphoheptulonate synthase AroG [Gammaproteobacteria bacterium]|nr:3-deoxy-7-phosphoheptulonate synthase AroG [Gammaproteobacteria bacterium]NIO61702.1 3-deoxy-7-phosphoheptulonate synthase AroG [Gammaproteobacteria bacterium]NIP49322.1 3-deoxy-7-phosphoheptulonate synthase AroG [Gammaproteobacteria bacterium]NIQ10544.1 3-deoxy-7-phosphoheptulonate synthase AroG [Gammaproteobacteria bacterium]NIQ18953.1 3-deoxy-7-phosphoheptulonate synthase AroG [Gammaproteobacteria bacterium]